MHSFYGCLKRWGLFIFFVIVFFVPRPARAEAFYQFELLWPVMLQPWYFARPEAVAIDTKGNVYIADTENNRIQKFTTDGFFITSWGVFGNGPGQFSQPRRIAVDSAGYVYVSDTENNRVQKFTPNCLFDSSWDGSGTGCEKFYTPIGIAADSSGFIYVVDSGHHCIRKFTSNGQFIATWGEEGNGFGQFQYPEGIAVSADGLVYVADSQNSRIQKFDLNGNFIKQWGTFGVGDGQFKRPSGIAVDISGNVYVSERIINNRIQKFDSEGNYITKWGGYGLEDGKFQSPIGLGIDTAQNVYVVDSANERIQKFTPNGLFLTKWSEQGTNNGQFSYPNGIVLNKNTGNVYVVDSSNDHVQKFTKDGEFILKWGTSGNNLGQFKGPERLATDANGNVYVADSFNNRIQKFDSNGENPSQFTNGEFSNPMGIDFDSAGNLYVADQSNHRIQKFDSQGNYVAQWGGEGIDEGQFFYPQGVAVDNYNNIYVADTANHRIQKFTSAGVFITKWGASTVESYRLLPGSGSGEFNFPYDVTVDEDNNVYVVDTGNNRIQKFDLNGNYLAQWGDKGSSPSQLDSPSDIAVKTDDGINTIYVTDTYNRRVQVFKEVTESVNSKAIIIAGGGPEDGNNLWDATQVATNLAYRALTYRGFSKNDIYYLSANTKLDLDSNGLPDDVRAAPTKYTLWQAITKWAVQEKADTLVLYMADHGGSGTFRLSGSEVLTVDELSEWLNTLQQQLSCKIIVVYDACESGSFLSKLQGSGRIIIASTLPGEQAKFLGQGTLSFSSFFWTHILNGLSIEEAFASSSLEINFAFANQSPQMAGDAQDVYIGSRGSHTAADAPQIGEVSPPQELSDGTTAVLSAASVTDPDGIARVWAVIWPPDYTPGNPDQPVIDLPSVDLTPVICDPTATGCLYNPQTGEGGYEISYTQFDQEGTYYIALYAMDRKGNTSLPKLTTVSRNYHITRKAIIVAGETGPDLSRDTINTSAALAYNALTAQLYGYEDIYLMSPTSVPDIGGNPPPTPVLPSLLYFEDYLKNLATTDGQLDLVVYLVGAGTPASFQMMGTTTLLATELDRMLDTLQTQKPGGKVTVIYDGDYSGSFIPLLIPPTLIPPTGEKRIVITSTCATSPAYFRGQGKSSFSSFFWQQVASGAILYDAFAYARSALQYLSWRQEIAFSCYGQQNPLLEADGDGVANEEADYQIARGCSIGMGIRFADDPPVIGSVSAIEDSATGIVTIVAEDITATKPLKRVWAVIKQIGYCPGGSGEQPAALIEKDLTDADDNGTYTVSFNPQDYGLIAFRVSVYAMDEDNNTSAPQETGVQQRAGQPDIYEPDDTPQEANPIVVNYGSTGPDGKPIGEAQPHNFHTASDMDWVVFHALAGKAYIIEAGNLEDNSQPVIELYRDINLTKPIAWAYMVVGEKVALNWECPAGCEGNYYVRLWNKLAYGGGDKTGYSLKVYDGGQAIVDTPVTGYIRNNRNNAVIVTGPASASPSVEWNDMENPGIIYSTNARRDGSYAYSLAPSSYKCTIKAAGYEVQEEYVDVPETNDTMPSAWLHDFYLEPKPATTTTTTITTTSSTTTTTVPVTSCEITSVTPGQIRIGFGLLPRIKRMTVTASADLEELGLTGRDLNFNGQRGIMVLGVPKVLGNIITANVLFWGVKPGTCTVQLGGCGSKDIEILRGF